MPRVGIGQSSSRLTKNVGFAGRDMHQAIRAYVRAIDRMNRFIGRCAMYLIFAMLAVLLYSSLSKAAFTPAIWTLETAQFLMVAYFLLGGAYSMQLDDHVRMDLLYGRWQPRTRAWVDVCTAAFLLFYLVLLLYGGISSTHYAFEYDETSYSAWAPRMAPIKVLMVIGIALMLLQAIAQFFKDVAAVRGESL
jgi:TRAP-type mannitol/chloroaromatic compound transport system permease small subunit